MIEDAVSGARAGRAAGMTVWAVNSDPSNDWDGDVDRSFARLDLATEEILEWIDA